MSTLPFWTAPQLSDQARFTHRFFGAQGGVSEGVYTSLNCGYGSDDDREAVTENRRRVAETYGRTEGDLVTVRQVHGRDVAVVETPWIGAETRPAADAMVTKTPGVVLGIMTADCAPILFADPQAGVIGAAHAGWRGAIGGIADATIDTMVREGAKREHIHAAVGPCIGPESYEVGAEFVQTFVTADAGNQAFFRPSVRDGHAMFDLPGYLKQRLSGLGIAGFDVLDLDTVPARERFFSYRRNTLEGRRDYGRMVATIALA